VEDGVPTQDIAGERLIMAAGALPCPCKDLGQEKRKLMEKLPLIGNRDDITGGLSLTLLRHKN